MFREYCTGKHVFDKITVLNCEIAMLCEYLILKCEFMYKKQWLQNVNK